MKSTLLTTLSLLFTSTQAAPAPSRLTPRATYPEPVPISGNITGVHDPSVIRRSDGTWLRFSTNGNIAIATAPELAGPWTYQGAMLPSGSSINTGIANQQLWAPDVFLVDGTYHAYYAVSSSGSQASDIGLATSSTGDVGTWTDHGSVGLPKSSSYNLIDPNVFRECSTCELVFNFGSAWGDIYQTSLSDDGSKWSGAAPQQKAYNSTGSITEGSFEFWWWVDNTAYYYLFFSSGACCNAANNLAAPGDEYKIMVCRATSAEGPFVDQAGKNCQTQNGGTLVLGSHGEHVYAPGGQGVILSEDTGRVALYYHYADPTIGYGFKQFQFGFNYLDFSSGWPVVVS